VKLYRMMKEAADGLPLVGDKFARLGVRPFRPGHRFDVPAVDPDDPVRPGEGGLSVFAGPPESLPAGLRPPKARDPLWEIDDADLGVGLKAVPAGPPHYVIEPDVETTLAAFQTLLSATRARWIRVEWDAL
jgi:hypothetical protein